MSFQSISSGFLAAFIGLICCGCDGGILPDASPKAGAQSTANSRIKVVVQEPYLSGWEKPAAVLVLSGEIHGYFEPCGCSPTQSGGFARRGYLVQQLEKRGWPVAALDVGGLLKRANRQDLIKFETMLAGMQKMHYAGLELGVEELMLGPDYLLSQYVPSDPKSIPLLGANVVFFGSPDLGLDVPVHSKVIKVGDVKIGVTGVLGLSHKELIAPDGVDTNISVLDPKEVLPKVIAELQAQKPDFLVLLSYGSMDEAKRLAEAFPQFRIILTSGSPDDAIPRPTVVKETWIIETGVKGRTVGVLGYFPDNEKRPFRYELIELDNKRFLIDDRMIELMRQYQQRLEDEKISQARSLPDPSGWKFVGAKTCGECHKKAYEHWKTTGHAKATDTLVHGRPGEEKHWVPRLFDPECLSCHTTGWEPQQNLRYDSGYFSEEASAQLRGQQCENCHGPGSKHIDLERAFAKDKQSVSKEDLDKLRKAVRRKKDQAEKQICAQCHDAENSPTFDFEGYWEEVAHPWMD